MANYKLLALVIGSILLIGLTIAGVVWYQTIAVDVTVNEALSAVPIGISVIGSYPGETIRENITVENKANVPLYTRLTWTEQSNVNSVTYTNGGALSGTQSLSPGFNILSVEWTINVDSPTGTFNGTIALERTTAP